jgi:predicted TIM-barrel fold metal-dependent hydrolase
MPAVPSATTFPIPKGACDCHTHVFLDRARYPFAADRKYTPPAATTQDLEQLLAGLGLDRVVIVQPSVYGSDNSATLAGIREIGLDRARGVAVIEENTSRGEMEMLATGGVRGIRMNFELKGEANHARAARDLEAMAEKIAPFGWHIQVYAQLGLIAAFEETIRKLAVPIVLDHFAGAMGEAGVNQPGLSGVLDLVRQGQAYVKVSAAYRSSRNPPDYGDLAPIARAFIAANPDRIVWGSDWPHPDPTQPPGKTFEHISPPLLIDDPGVFSLLARWAGDEATYRKILSDNPARLYDF